MRSVRTFSDVALRLPDAFMRRVTSRRGTVRRSALGSYVRLLVHHNRLYEEDDRFVGLTGALPYRVSGIGDMSK